MNVENKVYCIIIALLFSVSVILSSISTRKSYELGRLSNEYRERVVEAERTNRELINRLGQCKSVCDELRESSSRNVQTAREAVETVEELRVQVFNLECIVGGFDGDKYYSDTDNYLGLEGE